MRKRSESATRHDDQAHHGSVYGMLFHEVLIDCVGVTVPEEKYL